MARMMSIRLVGQMSSVAKCDDDGWVHLGMGMRGAIGCDGVAEGGVGVGVVVTFIGCDGCGNVGDDCRWGVDISFLWERSSSVGNLEDACQYALLSVAYCEATFAGSVVVVIGIVAFVFVDVVVQRRPSNSKV